MKTYTAQEVCEILHVNIATIYRWIRQGELSGAKSGKRWLFTEDDLEAFISNNKNRRRTDALPPGEHKNTETSQKGD